MLVKFFSRGSGSGDGPVNYLLGENRDRDGAKVLRGNAEITRELINSTDYAQRYTSGVLSFEESADDVSSEATNKIIDDFEKTLFPGLQSDQYNILWVEHKDKGRLELNFLIPNQELRSGKRLQPFFHVADMKRVNAFQQVINYHHKLSDPDDPSKHRITTPYFSRNANLSDVKEEDLTDSQKRLTARQQAKNEITERMYMLASNKRLEDRTAILDEIKNQGYEIKRVTKKSISVKHADFTKNLRLDDPIFSEAFKPELYTEKGFKDAQQDYEDWRPYETDKALKILNDGINMKAEYHSKRFTSKPPEPVEISINPTQDLEILKVSHDNDSPSFDMP